MRILVVFIFLFLSKLAHSYDFVDVRNSPIIVSMDEKKWNLITDKNYIPFLNFTKFYENLNTPQLSIYLDTELKKYSELYTYLSNDILIESQLDLFRDGKNLSTEDKKFSYNKFINSIFSLNKSKFEKIADLTKKNIGFTNQKKIIDHLYEGKLIEKNTNNKNDKYCSFFYFWSDKIDSDTYKIRIQTIICNLNINSGLNPFISNKKIENFIKNISFYNESKFQDLYIDEITKLLNNKKEKEKEKKKQEAKQKKIEEEEALKLKKLQEDEKLIKSIVTNIENETQIILKQLNSSIEELKNVNNNFDEKSLIKKLDNYLDFHIEKKESIESSLKNLNNLIEQYDGNKNDKDDLVKIRKNINAQIININSLVKEYKSQFNIYLSNVKKREKWVKKNNEEKEKERKKKELEDKKKLKELEDAKKLKDETIINLENLIKEKNSLVTDLQSINDELMIKLDLNKTENFVEELLLIQEKERADLENKYNNLIEINESLNADIKNLNSKHSYKELENLNNNISEINILIEDITSNFNKNNLIFKNLILTNLELKKQEKEKQSFTYILLGTIIFLIIILIIVFIYFIRSGRGNKITNYNEKPTVKEKKTEANKSTKSLPESSKIENPKVVTKNLNKNIIDEKKQINDQSKDQENNDDKKNTVEIDNSNTGVSLINEYIEAFKNPKSLQNFTIKWKVDALDRLTSMSSSDEVILESSKKIIDRSNFWSIRDPNNELLYFILPGKILWSRINEILSDNSRFGYMNFNGVYELKEAKENTINEITVGQKDESGKITIIEMGSINIYRVI